MGSKGLMAGVSLLFVLAGAWSVPGPQAASALDGAWAVKYADGSEGRMTMGKDILMIEVPAVGELKGRLEVRSDYFESILDRGGIYFVFGYQKGDSVEGKLQENFPCTELKKAFKSGVTEASTTCQAPFTATRK